MAIERDKWGTVLEAAQSALMDIGEDNSRIMQFVHWGLEGARDWHMDMSRSVKTKVLTMTDYKAIKTPSDYVDWVKVGVKCGGIIKTFTHDNNIALHHDIVDGKKIENKDCQDVDIWDLATTDTMVPFYGADEPIFGLAYKDNGLGYFNEHHEAGEIQFRTKIPKTAKIILEYVSDGWEPNKTTLLHPYAFKLITLYIHWMNLKHNKSNPRSHVQEAKNEYWDEFDRVSWRMFSITLEDVLEVQREAFVSGFQN